MRNLLREVEEIDAFILGKMSVEDTAFFKAKMDILPGLKHKIARQRMVHHILRLLGRRELRDKLDTIYSKLMNEENFKNELNNIFK